MKLNFTLLIAHLSKLETFFTLLSTLCSLLVMAEALAIIGLVSNIISLIDIGLKIASGTRDVRHSLHGTTADIHELDLVAADVQRYNDQVKQQKASGQNLSDHEQQILAMVGECDTLVIELRKAIKTLKIRDGRSKTLESGRVAFQTLWKQKEIDGLRGWLDSLDQRIRCNVEHIIRRYVYPYYSHVASSCEKPMVNPPRRPSRP